MTIHSELKIDAVIVLAFSDEYSSADGSALHFAKTYPVILIKPDLDEEKFYFEETKSNNLIILHVYSNYLDPVQVRLITEALNSRGIIRPLLWIDNPHFINFIQKIYSPYKICHVSGLASAINNQQTLVKVLVLADRVVCSSLDLKERLLKTNCKLEQKITLMTNAYDFEFHPIPERQDFLEKQKILVLYEGKSLTVGAIRDHLMSFKKYSMHHINYFDATSAATLPDFLSYDSIIIHYSIRLSAKTGSLTISPTIRNALKLFPALKIAFIQDEYEHTNMAIEWINDLGIQIVFTCVPEEYIEQIYSPSLLPFVEFYSNLTGYVPDALINYPVKPVVERSVCIAYRGRNLPFWYGGLGQEKEWIGKVMKPACIKKNMIEDIEWDSAKRIYGDDWLLFLSSAKATLGTESGSNIFDFDGELSAQIKSYLKENPDAAYKDVHTLFLEDHDDFIKMNQISPKVFEAICLHTALILLEGHYSGVLIPNRHYIPLKKDFSNIDEVFDKIKDEELLKTMTQLAYEEIVMSGQYSYTNFLAYFDSIVNLHSRMPVEEEQLFANLPNTQSIEKLSVKRYLKKSLSWKVLIPIRSLLAR